MSGGEVDIKELLPLIFALSKFVLRSFPQLVLTSVPVIYYKFGNFRENFIFANSVKIHTLYLGR